ncbi:LuxR C-terminal-related transcriptional regulator [Anaerolineales bacterium HSG6]|nr:LuxR C-terminal-related transcriptional regulator [Anaerolineales bacterium HSG6]
MSAELLELHFPSTGRIYQIVPRANQEIIAGRAETCHICLVYFFAQPVTIISSRHFKLYYRPDRGFFIMDVHSRNGTWLNGEPLQPDEGRYIRHGDLITLTSKQQFVIEVRLNDAKPTAKANQSTISVAETLTDRELEVLRLLPTHLTQREIAAHLHVSHNTVKTHIQRIYGKLGARRKSEAIERAEILKLL